MLGCSQKLTGRATLERHLRWQWSCQTLVEECPVLGWGKKGWVVEILERHVS